MTGGLYWGQTGEEMIREGSARHVLDDGSATLVIWVMDRQTWPGRGIDVW